MFGFSYVGVAKVEQGGVWFSARSDRGGESGELSGKMEDVTLLREAENRMEHLLAQEDEVWKIRSRSNWLLHGNRNTSYFYHHASQRNVRNFIHHARLCNVHRKWIEDEKMVGGNRSRLTTDMVGMLDIVFTEEEVVLALKQMHPTKAPGPDGFHALFFQKYWHVIREEV